jgi:hypothetical protein
MLRRKIIGFSVAVLVIFVAIWLVMAYMNSTVEYYHVFKEKRELFEVVKDEVEDSGLMYQSNYGDGLLYRNGGNAAPDQFKDEVSAILQKRIKQINKFSGNKLDHLKYAESDGEVLISFIFDWERAYGDTYHIVYCKSQERIVQFYNDKKVKFHLKDLENDWYGIWIR